MLCLVIITPLGQGLAAAVELTTTSTAGNIAQILKKMTATHHHHHHHLHRQCCTNIKEDYHISAWMDNDDEIEDGLNLRGHGWRCQLCESLDSFPPSGFFSQLGSSMILSGNTSLSSTSYSSSSSFSCFF